jgi:hypothetical protein
MVATAILMLLTGACGMALRASLDYHRRVQQQSQMEEDLLRALGSISKELGESATASVEWQAAPAIALTFPTPRDANGSLLIDHAAGNRLRYQTVLSYRVEGPDLELRRYIDRLPTVHKVPPHPLELTPPRDDSYFSDPSREFRTIATGVTDFSITAFNIDDYSEAHTVVTDFNYAHLLKLQLRIEHGTERKYAVSAEIDIVPSN